MNLATICLYVTQELYVKYTLSVGWRKSFTMFSLLFLICRSPAADRTNVSTPAGLQLSSACLWSEGTAIKGTARFSLSAPHAFFNHIVQFITEVITFPFFFFFFFSTIFKFLCLASSRLLCLYLFVGELFLIAEAPRRICPPPPNTLKV